MPSFSAALEANPAPARLGDVALRFEPSMLIAETLPGQRTWRPTLAWLGGVSLLLAAVGALVSQADFALSLSLVVGGGLLIGLGFWLERLERRRRRFVANFATTTLRLDFQSPIAGQPRTLLIPFDDVKAVELLVQADGLTCLTVDFERQRQLLREVLAAWIPAEQQPDAERLQRVLRGAFGLGLPPADSPALVAPHDESSFEG